MGRTASDAPRRYVEAWREARYTGIRTGRGAMVYRPDGSRLEPGPSLELCRHSPDGFGWGYRGSGPAQLALALILDHTGDAGLALRLYQDFKREAVARWGVGWVLTVAALDRWITKRQGSGERGA